MRQILVYLLPKVRREVEKETNGVVVIVLISAVLLLEYGHIAEIKDPVLVQSVIDPYKEAVLVKGVVNDLRTKMEQHLVC